MATTAVRRVGTLILFSACSLVRGNEGGLEFQVVPRSTR